MTATEHKKRVKDLYAQETGQNLKLEKMEVEDGDVMYFDPQGEEFPDLYRRSDGYVEIYPSE